ncbi:MAG: ABC transporter ATP-binding protein [Planctomycetaceae bacterium]|nr:ABC transporter ATP-binding protein [Planctomycetaceae bacterium]
MPLLQVSNLHVSYGSIRALHGIDLEVEAGKIVTLIGANGAGKSTTLRAISGMIPSEQGAISFDGHSILGTPPHRLLEQGMAHVPEGRGIFGNLTVEDNLALGAYIRNDRDGIRNDHERVLELFPRLKERLKQSAGTLSGGEQQMLAIARGMMSRPRLLLLDEPSLGLAPQFVQTIFAIIREVNQQGTTILLIEQNAHMALQVAHQAYVLETGAIAMRGPASELAASDEVRKRYLGIA